MTHAAETLILDRSDVRMLLDMRECIDAVEAAFRRHARGETIPPGVLGTHVEHGGFHIKTAGLLGHATDDRPVFVAKVNANFPGNRDRFGLPTIQGIVALFDARNGRLLALLDSSEITAVRTAAATAVAAKYLTPNDATAVTICGCGDQSRSQLRALACVRDVTDVVAFDIDRARAEQFGIDIARELGVGVTVTDSLGVASRSSRIWITCTSSRRWLVGREHVAPGTFIAAVGADNPEKQEIEPELLASCTVVADILDQCASIGDLHHALAAGLMTRADVHAELAEIVAGTSPARGSPNEIVVFDSTGTALQDVAATLLVYDRAVARGTMRSMALVPATR